ncbi:MAG: c-type cytochrome [Gammaproteobacteria bacterium]|nr:c-type cytochrome [Gammaproteobacteria bacterium]
MNTKKRQVNWLHYIISLLIPIALLLNIPASLAAKTDYMLGQQKMKIPANNQATPARIALGKALFFDPRLSGSNWISCGTCHNPALGWSDGLPTGIGEGQQVLHRSTPTILNTGYNRHQFWDGRERTLEAQATGPIQAGVEMNQTMGVLIEELELIKGYKPLFEAAYPGEGISEDTIGKAIANFERTIVSDYSAPFDHWVRGKKDAISASAKRGFELFDGKARCNFCHQGHNFTDDGFHNIGLPNTDDPGRYAIAKIAILKGAFKTPTLRDIARTPPYMHNGAYATLEAVVEHYNEGGKNKSNLSPNMKKLNLSKQEKADLVSFLNTLTDKQKEFSLPILPN